MFGKDPWLSNVESDVEDNKCEFEDDFVVKSNRLPDSDEYVAALGQ